MPDNFDPYLHWLGIRDRQRPPNHYRLLGVELFECDPDVISNAVDRQMAHVRTFQAGPRSAESQRLLNELASAKVCLLNPQKKAVYDAKLRADLAVGSMPVAGGLSEPGGAAAPAGPPPVPSQQAQRLALLWVGVSALVAVGVVLVAVLVLVLGGRGARSRRNHAAACPAPRPALVRDRLAAVERLYAESYCTDRPGFQGGGEHSP